MPRFPSRALVRACVAAPLALVVSACGDDAATSTTQNAEPIAAIAAPAGQSWTEVVSTTPEGGYRMGNPDAPIKLVEYGSLTCPHCADFASAADAELRETFVESGRVSYEYRNFVMNPLDLTMAMMVRCGAPESFFALVQQTYANQSDIVETWSGASEAQLQAAGNLPPEQRYGAVADIAGLKQFYGARGIAADQANQCLARPDTAEQLVDRTEKQSREMDISGTPTFFVNGQKLDSNTWPEVKARLETMGAR